MIDNFFENYKLNNNIEIKFINKQGIKETRTFRMKQMRIYSQECFFVPLDDDKNRFYELYIDKNRNIINLRSRLGSMVNIISKKILELNYNEPT